MMHINNLSTNNYLIPWKLLEALYTEKLSEEHSYGLDNKNNIYIVKLTLCKDGKIIYSYMQYNKLFETPILVYLMSRNTHSNQIRKELGNFLALISNLDTAQGIHTLKELRYNSNEDLLPLYEISSYTNSYVALTNIFSINYSNDVNKIVEVLENLVNKKYDKFFKNLLNELSGLNYNINYLLNDIENLNNKLNLVNHCLVVVDDLKEFTQKMNKHFITYEGIQSKRAEVSQINNFLSHLDIDFRNNLYYHHKYHVKNGILKNRFDLGRDKFSFKNIHMNLGTVRYYTQMSSVSKKGVSTDTKYSNRDALFQENYLLIKNILDKNFNVGTTKIQKEIELLLFNQENIFKNLSSARDIVNFNDEVYDLVDSKRKELIILISKNKELNYKVKTETKKHLPWINKMIDVLGEDKISDLLLEYFMRIVTNETMTINDVHTPGIPTITAFEKFGDILVKKYIYNLYLKSEHYQKGLSLTEFKRDIRDEIEIFFDDVFNSKLGGHFVLILVKIKFLEEAIDYKVGGPDKKEKLSYLRVIDDVRSKIVTIEQKVFHLPQKLPMVCEPKKFIYSSDKTKNVLGGYLLNDELYTDEIFKQKKGYENTTELNNNNIVVDLINGLARTPYKINNNTLQFIKEYGIEKEILLESNNSIDVFIKSPYTSFNKVERKLYRSQLSKIILERNILSIAECYCNVDKIYFPVRLDQRTRLYCETEYFDYQKSDLAKGLISFANPSYLYKTNSESIKFFKAFGANMYGHGLDKKSLNLREKWVNDNITEILNFRYNNIVNKAENKACFVSFCFEYERLISFMEDNNSTTFATSLPIQLDATCNGYQHLALLTKETKLFDKLNLSPSTFDDAPDDFYAFIVQKIEQYISNRISHLSNIEREPKEDKTFNSLLNLEKISFDRSIVKKSIMTLSYNAGVPKLVDTILANLTERMEPKNETTKYAKSYYIYKDPSVKLSRFDVLTYVMCLRKVIDSESPKIKELSKYLDTVVMICTKLSLPVPWLLPSGAIIKESYLKQEELPPLKAFSFVKTRYTFKKYLKGVFDLRKQKRATMPNLIHSLDASTIALLYKKFEVTGPLYTVHDCFATTANSVPFLISILKSTYIKLYSEISYLKQFDDLVKLNINKTFGKDVYNFGKYVTLPNSSKEIIEFPDIEKIITLDSNTYIKFEGLKKSSYTLV